MKKLSVNLGSRSYEVTIGSGLLAQAGRYLKGLGLGPGVVIITNPEVRGLYGHKLVASLAADGLSANTLEVAEGEERKSLETAGRLYAELSRLGAERSTPILALGGGVIGDLAGFVAATYLRGVPLVQLPTTLLAQVDSSIGGKVAVNHGQLKNNIGAFYQPRLVLSDTAALKTLPAREFANGLAEVIKSAVIGDKGLFAFLEANLDSIKGQEEEALEEVVFRCARIKAAVVEKDETDQGLRNVLNFGHTVGHGIETASGFMIKHGAAVAIGMLAAAAVAQRLGLFGKDELARLKALVQAAGLPAEVSGGKVKDILAAMRHDKKIQGGRLRFALPRAIGDVILSDEVELSLVEEVLTG
jgi:3-dehydroquinate synthase